MSFLALLLSFGDKAFLTISPVVQTRTGYLYCAACDDFVYTHWLDKLRVGIQEEYQGMMKRCTVNTAKPLIDNFPVRKKRKREVGLHKQLRMFSNRLPRKVLTAPKGLYNLGHSCYLSVILQAMAHNPHMTDYFLRSGHRPKHCANESCVACALTQSLKELLITEEEGGHAPVDLLYRSWQNNPVSWPSLLLPENNHSAPSQALAGYGQQDAHEYFQFILNQLHESSGFHPPHGANDCACIAHKTFSGRLRSTVNCLHCGTLSVTYDPVADISLDIRAATARATPATPLTLTDCLRNFATPERLPAVEGYLCESETCKRTAQTVTKQLTIKKLPATLCIHIKRYEHLGGQTVSPQKLLHRVEFPLELNMLPYTAREQDRYWKGCSSYSKWLLTAHSYEREKMIDATISSASSEYSSSNGKESPGWYDLSSMVVHYGNMEGGHYVIYCKVDGRWLQFDDHDVSIVSEEYLLGGNPYLMFYELRDKFGEEDLDIESDL